MTAYLEALTKIPLYAGLLLMIGFFASLWLAGKPAAGATDVVHIRRRSTAGQWAAAIVFLFLFLRLFAHTYALFGDDAWSWESISTVAMKSRWGEPWRLQVILAFAVMFATAFAALRFTSITNAAMRSLFVAGLAWAFTMMGHSASHTSTSLVATAHILGGGAWLGTLAMLVIGGGANGRQWARFSTLAMAASAAVIVSGLYLAVSYVPSWRDLAFDSYGRLLLTKLAFVGAIGVCGFVNWRRVKAVGVPSTARLELLLAAVVVVITAFLTETAHP